MAWFTSFSTVRMDKPLIGDLENDEFFGVARFKWLTGKQIDFRYDGSARDYIFRGDFSTNVVGTSGEIVDGTFRSLTLATNNSVNWTLTGVSYSILDALDRASHAPDPGDSVNYPVNVMLLSGNDRIDDESTGASWLAGYAGVDTLLGGAGNDTLDGGSSVDFMTGGAGNDTYLVDTTSDVVTEIVDGEDTGGTDIVKASVSYTLGLDLENLTLTGVADIEGRGNTAINTIVGNLGNNALFGRGANDVLNGGDGDDTLEGGAGNDSMNGAAGSDTASFAHAAKGVVVSLAVTGVQATGAGNDTLTGFENLLGGQFDDKLTGNGFANVLEGGRGNDTLNGANGVDTASYAHAKAAVTVSLASGQSTGTTEGSDTLQNIENLLGGAFNDSLTGSGTANVLNGGQGTDTLAGGVGQDQFIFDNMSNTDVISDFAPGVDEILLMTDVFTAFDPEDPGVVLPNEFVSGAGVTTASTADQRLIYNTTTGALYYDPDGNNFQSAVQIATLTGAPATLAPSDFHLG